MQLKVNSAEHLFAVRALPRAHRGLAALIAAAGLAACSSAKPVPEVKETTQPIAETVKPTDTKEAQSAADFKAQGQAELDAALAKLRGVSVFFDFDAASLTKEAEDRLSEVAAILVRHPDLKVKIEGNADERGSEQYNLALGQRRAESVKKYLANLGAKTSQVIAVSFGAEKPVDPGHNEEAWKKNRRADVDPNVK
jgi:peptidoglycan-associated lipoprotein